MINFAEITGFSWVTQLWQKREPPWASMKLIVSQLIHFLMMTNMPWRIQRIWVGKVFVSLLQWQSSNRPSFSSAQSWGCCHIWIAMTPKTLSTRSQVILLQLCFTVCIDAFEFESWDLKLVSRFPIWLWIACENSLTTGTSVVLRSCLVTLMIVILEASTQSEDGNPNGRLRGYWTGSLWLLRRIWELHYSLKHTFFTNSFTMFPATLSLESSPYIWLLRCERYVLYFDATMTSHVHCTDFAHLLSSSLRLVLVCCRDIETLQELVSRMKFIKSCIWPADSAVKKSPDRRVTDTKGPRDNKLASSVPITADLKSDQRTHKTSNNNETTEESSRPGIAISSTPPADQTHNNSGATSMADKQELDQSWTSLDSHTQRLPFNAERTLLTCIREGLHSGKLEESLNLYISDLQHQFRARCSFCLSFLRFHYKFARYCAITMACLLSSKIFQGPPPHSQCLCPTMGHSCATNAVGQVTQPLPSYPTSALDCLSRRLKK